MVWHQIASNPVPIEIATTAVFNITLSLFGAWYFIVSATYHVLWKLLKSTHLSRVCRKIGKFRTQSTRIFCSQSFIIFCWDLIRKFIWINTTPCVLGSVQLCLFGGALVRFLLSRHWNNGFEISGYHLISEWMIPILVLWSIYLNQHVFGNL